MPVIIVPVVSFLFYCKIFISPKFLSEVGERKTEQGGGVFVPADLQLNHFINFNNCLVPVGTWV